MENKVSNQDSKEIGMSSDMPRFIVGMSRAGTTWLCRVLNEHPEVAAFGEICYWGRAYVEPSNGSSYDKKTIDRIVEIVRNIKLTGVIGEKPGCLKNIDYNNWPEVVDNAAKQVASVEEMTPGLLYQHLIGSVQEIEGKPYVVEKTPHHLNWVDRIVKELPDAKFIIMLRNPYTFMLSYKHQGDRKRESARKTFQSLYHPIIAALVWRGYVLSAQHAMDSYPDQTMRVDFDKTRDNPKDVIEEIQTFLHIPVVSDLSSRVGQVNTSFPVGERPQLMPEDYFWINLIARREIKLLGEGIESPNFDFKSLYRVAYSFVSIIIWPFLNYRNLQSIAPGSLFKYCQRWLHLGNKERA